MYREPSTPGKQKRPQVGESSALTTPKESLRGPTGQAPVVESHAFTTGQDSRRNKGSPILLFMHYDHDSSPLVIMRDDEDDAEYNEDESLAEDDLGDEGADMEDESDEDETV